MALRDVFYNIALFLAILGAVSGAVDVIDSQIDTNSHFTDVYTPDLQVMDISKDTFSQFDDQDSNLFKDIVNFIDISYHIIWGAIKGVLGFYTVLNKIFYVPSPVDGSNLFAPIGYIIQMGIYVSGIFFVYDMRRGK